MEGTRYVTVQTRKLSSDPSIMVRRGTALAAGGGPAGTGAGIGTGTPAKQGQTSLDCAMEEQSLPHAWRNPKAVPYTAGRQSKRDPGREILRAIWRPEATGNASPAVKEMPNIKCEIKGK